MAFRDHNAVIVDKFQGLYNRGDNGFQIPFDHFRSCSNIAPLADSFLQTRPWVQNYQTVGNALNNVLKVKKFEYNTISDSFLVLITTGKLYHVLNGIPTLILTVATMVDFGMVSYHNRAYITPYLDFTRVAITQQQPVTGESLYVYDPAVSATARVAAGAAPVGTVTPANGAAGHTDAGLHIFGVVYETSSGYLTAPAAFASFTTGAALSVSFTTIPTGGASVTKRHLVASRVIVGFNGDLTGYDLFFLPNGTINDNVTTVLANVSFYDADLIDDASHLLDNYATIPAGVNLCIYNDRLCLTTAGGENSILVSFPGEPEAISQIDGFLLMPPDGNPITNAAVLRDVLYGFKRNKTAAWVDNGDVPTSWPFTEIDNSIGAGTNSISNKTQATDYLLVGSYTGLMLFNGRYVIPELSWKIGGMWQNPDFGFNFINDYRKLIVFTDFTKEMIYVVNATGTVFMGDFSNGLSPKSIRWFQLSFPSRVNSILLYGVNSILIGLYNNGDVLFNTSYSGLYILVFKSAGVFQHDIVYDYTAGTPPVLTNLQVNSSFIMGPISDKEGNIQHLVGYRVQGAGSSLQGIGGTFAFTRDNTMRLTNYEAQRINLFLSLQDVNEQYFYIEKIIAFVKAISADYPQ